MNLVKYRYFNVTLHLLAWSILLFFPYFIATADNQYRIGPLPGLYFTLSSVIHMCMFYTNTLFLYPKLLNKANWLLYFIAAFLLIFSSVKLKFYILAQWFPNDLADVRSHVLFPSVLVFVVSILFSITLEKIRAEKLQKEKEAMQLGIELKFLRSQVSPHFLFNILTSLVTLARKRSDKLETSLLMLSNMMRYMLYDAGKKITLQQEVEYLESYTSLQTLRFGADVRIECHIELSPSAANHTIEPMLLIPFVENAFKHGTDYVDEPFIHISLAVQEGALDFFIKNKFEAYSNTSKDDNSGIGLNNVRSRLALLYPNRHELVINNDKNIFSIHLTLQLL